ncbi:MAG: outer membrane protein assembly factor BamD [Candidatus Competibacterales bacterium]|nr:outer membrane protein assembly factor BamD [Candidatus Competibacterales bacterium]
MSVVYRVLTPCFILTLSLLPGCAWLQQEEYDPTADWSASQFYSTGKSELQAGNYDTAIEHFETLQARYPFGRYAQQAQLEISYAHYKSGQSDQAIAAADRFIRIYPRHAGVDYAYYLRGLANYSRGSGMLERVFPRDIALTDSNAAQQAFSDFAELVRKFPDSRYAEDARQRMRFLRNKLAEHEVNVGRYYLARKAYVAAANRGRHVLENYRSTPEVEPALAIMAEAYQRLGMTELARDSYRVLQNSYPESPYLARLNALFAGEAGPPPDARSLALHSPAWDCFD